MKVAVLSDLHLSRPTASCGFGCDAAQLMAVLDRIEATHEALLLAGDIFDLNVRERFCDPRDEWRAAREAWRPLVERLERLCLAQVYGNNDHQLAREGFPEVAVLQAAGTRLVMMHGHQFEPAAAWLMDLKATVKWVAAWNQRHGMPALGDALYRANSAVSRNRPTRLDPLTRQALAYLAQHPEVHILVCGHSHYPRVEKTAWGIYANAGACSFGRLDWLSIDLAAREVHCHTCS
ncbi:MAG: metallophosphoesterase family protein [Myxococcota bacterium]